LRGKKPGGRQGLEPQTGHIEVAALEATSHVRSRTRTARLGAVLAVQSAQFAVDLAECASDAQVRLHDLGDPSRPSLNGVPLTGPTNWINALAFSPDCATLAAASSDKSVAAARPITAASPINGRPTTAGSF
jgi:WD40 repeat protein